MIELVPGRLGDKGDAVAILADGKRMHIRGALPGETVRVRTVRSTPSYEVGEIEAVLDASDERRQPPCVNVELGCGGCQWQHISIEEQRAEKHRMVDDALTKVGISPPPDWPTVALEPWHYRTTIRAEVRDGIPSFFHFRSRDTVPASGCMVAHPLLDDLLSARYRGAEQVVLRCGVRTGERMAWVRPSSAKDGVATDARRAHIIEVAGGRTWRISARSFFQARPDGVDSLVGIVQGHADELGTPRSFVDLYSGVGVFAGVLAERGWSGTAVEGSESSVRDARHNLVGLDVKVVHDDVNRFKPAPVSLAVADPSRSGLGPRAARTLVDTGAQRVILVSCDPRSMARDARRLVDAGYGLTRLTGVDMFPQTFRVEVVSVFDRIGT
ncbi:MAG: class I SAM-dependent RNA methyltransferase [Acidimicrobiales bacterium]